ncbi:MAG: DUF1640 domain-containing protein [Magnetococcales bacterium]|nr:DUF1640 domain-containing protein [Magnetococcales bacterium]
MGALTFDTHAFVKRLKDAGFTDIQAEAMTEAVRTAQESRLDDLVTKRDLADAKLEIIKWVIGASGAVIAAIKLMPGG